MNWWAVLQSLLGAGIISSTSHKPGYRSSYGPSHTPSHTLWAAAEKIQQLQSAGGVLWSQFGLLGRLATIEWIEEKARWRSMLMTGLAGFAFLLCALLFMGVLVMALTWDTDYRYWSLLLLVVVYAIGGLVAWRALKRLMNRGELAFASTRKELLADIALVKEQLWP